MQNCLKFNKTGGGLHRAETDGLPACLQADWLEGTLSDCSALSAMLGAAHRRHSLSSLLALERVVSSLCGGFGWGRGEANLKGSKWANLHYYYCCVLLLKDKHKRQ